MDKHKNSKEERVMKDKSSEDFKKLPTTKVKGAKRSSQRIKEKQF